MRSTLRLTLALQQLGPVIWTELGQYCCSSLLPNSTTKCNDDAHGDHFVHNVLNLAAQLDVSWTGWAWRGPNGGNCGSPDMRAAGWEGLMMDGSKGGANWTAEWAQFIASPAVAVEDKGDDSKIAPGDYEVPGFLPKPCIVPQFGMGSACGWPLGSNVSRLPFNSLWNSSVGESVLPGLPPSGPPSACFLQACPGYECLNTSGINPMPRPCSVPA